ncbi:hypothetical protein [Streptomyces parvulus]|nr:hypothetical protein [Streptomyces parvulus]
MGDGKTLIWGDGKTQRELRGKSGITRDRYGVVKFPKSMCGKCNNERSKPFDAAYETYSKYLQSHIVRIMPGVDLASLYGPDWSDQIMNLARYHAKHFGCRMVRASVPVPQSLRDFLNGAEDMPDAHMSIISTDSIRKQYGKGLSLSPDLVWIDKDSTRFVAYVMAAYVGAIGVRYEWLEKEIPKSNRSQFFSYPVPVINFFKDEVDMATGNVRKPGWFARLVQWSNSP